MQGRSLEIFTAGLSINKWIAFILHFNSTPWAQQQQKCASSGSVRRFFSSPSSRCRRQTLMASETTQEREGERKGKSKPSGVQLPVSLFLNTNTWPTGQRKASAPQWLKLTERLVFGLDRLSVFWKRDIGSPMHSWGQVTLTLEAGIHTYFEPAVVLFLCCLPFWGVKISWSLWRIINLGELFVGFLLASVLRYIIYLPTAKMLFIQRGSTWCYRRSR